MGKFEVYRQKENGELELISEFPNHFVNSGKQFMLDFAFNSVNWLSGAAGAGEWNAGRYLGVGTSTNTNNGNPGPTGTTGVATNSSWQGVADNDYKLTAEYTGTVGLNRATCTCIRATNSAYLWATITDANVDSGAFDISEIGIFIASGHETFSDPTSQSATPADRNHAMIIRGIPFYQQGDYYYIKPIPRAAGESLIVKYSFTDFEG